MAALDLYHSGLQSQIGIRNWIKRYRYRPVIETEQQHKDSYVQNTTCIYTNTATYEQYVI